jgi:Cu(I)/Ag(I) efflux system protein CusF
MRKLMKIFFISALIALYTGAMSTPGIAQTAHGSHRSRAATSASAPNETPMIEGVVKKINKYSGRVTLFHGPLPNGVPATTMPYSVKDQNWLDEMKVGQKIRFVTDPADGGKTLVRFEPVK